MNHYTIVGLASNEVDQSCKKLRKSFGINLSEVPDHEGHLILKDTAHCAVKRTFYLNDGVTEQDLFEKLADFSFVEVTLEAKQLGRFLTNEYGGIVFAQLEIIPDFYDIHEDLVKRVAPISNNKYPQYELGGYRAHIGLSYEIPKEKIDAVEKKAQELLPIQLRFSKLYLYRMCNSTKNELELLREYAAKVS
jgi:hypothetical protein